MVSYSSIVRRTSSPPPGPSGRNAIAAGYRQTRLHFLGLGIVLQGWLGVHTVYLLALFVGFVVCCAFLAIFRRCLKSNSLKPNAL